jgi:hypothetical protein
MILDPWYTQPPEPDTLSEIERRLYEGIRLAALRAKGGIPFDPSQCEENGHQRGTDTPSERPKIALPAPGVAESVFAERVGDELSKTEKLFNIQDQAVEVIQEDFNGKLDRNKLAPGGLKFQQMAVARAKTWIEQYVETGVWEKSIFLAKTMSEACSRGLLASPQFLSRLPRVERIVDVAIPVLTEKGDVVFPQPGFNKDLRIYCSPSSPPMKLLSLGEALSIIERAHLGFCWRNEQSKIHAIARILTPFARGLMGFSERTPLWFYGANRPRCGKDYLAGVTQIAYLGHVFEDFALTDNGEENTKRITSALRSGRRFMHFANCQGHIKDAGFIQAITSARLRVRSLGSNDEKSDLDMPNEIDYSLSANVGLTYREDVEPRVRKIDLEFNEEDPNKRVFPLPHLHDWVKNHRADVLSAIHTIYHLWAKDGMKLSATPFSSFKRWSETVGGVMQFAGFGDPSLPHEGEDLLGGDEKDRAMKALYQVCYDNSPNEAMTKKEIFQLIIANKEEISAFDWFGDLSDSSKQKNFATNRTGKALIAYARREIGGIRLTIDRSAANSNRWEYKFCRA